MNNLKIKVDNLDGGKLKTIPVDLKRCSAFAKKTDYGAKELEIEGKYFTTSDYNKFMSEILEVKINEKNYSTNLIFLISLQF